MYGSVALGDSCNCVHLAWCCTGLWASFPRKAGTKLQPRNFIGMVIPLGAKVFFKPSDARERDQDHKFDPKSIPGIFAGYVMGTGMNWSRKYKVWAISDFARQNLGYDAESCLLYTSPSPRDA